ncbi:MAG TPA: ABC transporter permease [Candidatus Sulfotelmatobacter sp.]|nr:ABC transporter permease [Candidatus Sulfotelmatobacter sp.]
MILRNLIIAIRVLTRSPQFTLTAVVTIALGLGASAAIFSVANAVLLQPIPYRDADRLVIAGMELRQRHVRDLQFSNADYIDLRDGTKDFFEDFAGVFTFRGVLPGADGTAEQVRNAIVTTNFFRLMGERIAIGRDFQDEDGVPQPQAAPGTTPGPQLPLVAIISWEYFQRRYGANAAILGHPLVPGAPQAPVVVGVLAPKFRLYFPPEANEEEAPDIWVANRLDYDAANRIAFSIRPIGRLKPGVSLEQAQKAAERVAAETRKNFVISGTAGYFIDLEPLRQHMVAGVRPAILALMGSAIFLLLIACANVANLLLVRASLRERELAVRAAIGADRWRLLVPLLSEAFVIAAAGSVAGLALAWIGIHVLPAVAPQNLPRVDTVRIDFAVIGFTALACLAATAIFGVIPAWRASRPGVSNLLRGSSRNAGLLGGNTLRSGVVTVEVALSFVLLVGSGLMVRSFFELQHRDPGFDAHRLLTFQVVSTDGGGDTPDARAAFVRRIEDRLRAIPGVESVAASTPFPLDGGFSPIRWGTGEALADASKFQAADNEIVLPGYFETLRVPLLAGRTFTGQDNLPHRDFVIIDDMLAKKAFHGEAAVGKRILIRVRSPQPEWVEVIGVIAHQHATSLVEPGREQVYFTDAFVGSGQITTWVIRTGNDPSSYGNAVRSAMREVDSHLLVTRIQPGDFLIYKAQGGTRFSLLLIGVFALVAGVLAGVGLYGVLSTAVRQRTSEIGVRMALGAEPGRIFQLVVGEGFRLIAIGIVIGLIAAVGLTRLMNAMLVGVKATDPATFGAMALVFVLIGAAASWLPARRAAALDPVSALRDE